MIKIVPKVWGEERHIVNNDKYCGKILILNKGWRCSLHFHKIKLETFHCLKGLVGLELEEAYNILMPGDTIDIPVGNYHRFTGLEDSQILEISTHDDVADNHRKEESGRDENIVL